MAEGQTDEGASMDPTDCFSIQRPLIRPCGPPSPLWGEGLALGQRPPLRRPNSAQNRAFFPLQPLTAGRKGDKMAPHRKKAVTGRSTRGPGPQRGAAWCKAPDGPAEGAREPRSGNAPPCVPVTDFECAPTGRESRWYHGPSKFALSLWLGAFLFCVPFILS